VIHIQNIIDAIGQGSIFALIAVGIGLVFGVLRLINFAYGQLIMLAAYTLAFTDSWPDAASVVLAVIVAVAASLVLERVAYRPLRSADPSTMLVATFAIAFLLENAALVQYTYRQQGIVADPVGTLSKLNEAVTKAKTARVQRESVYQQVAALPPGASPDSLPVIAQNVTIQGLRSQLSILQRQKAQLSERYGEKHPEIQKVNAQIADAQRQIQQETERALLTVRQEYDSARLEEQTLSRSLDAAKADATDLNHKSINYNIMEREAQSNRAVLQSLMQRENELSVAANSRANNVRIVDRAEVPKSPITPGGRRTWLMALVMGFVLSVAVAFGLDYMNDTIKTPEDVARRLKLPFLGIVPAIRGDKHPLLTSSDVPHDFGESFRALRTAILSKYSEPGAKTMVVTSAQPLEGKTTTACNIAMALAYGGARVLIIDADMRRPGMHRTLRLNNDRGLSQVLVGQARVRDVIQRTVDPNLLAVTYTYDNGTKVVPSFLLQPVIVYKDNYQKVLVDSGYYTAAQLT